jgi:hypothetical protein
MSGVPLIAVERRGEGGKERGYIEVLQVCCSAKEILLFVVYLTVAAGVRQGWFVT